MMTVLKMRQKATSRNSCMVYTLQPFKALTPEGKPFEGIRDYWFVWPEGNWPPDWAWFLPRFFLHSVTDGVFVPCRCRLWLAQLGTLHFQHNHRLDCTDIINWTKLDNAITKFNNEMHSADNWVLNPVILHYWHILPILILCSALLQFVLLKALYK